MINDPILVTLIAFAVAAIASPFVLKGLKFLKSSQTISAHVQEHAHKQGTPTMGGFMIIVALMAGMIAGWRPEFAGPALLFAGFTLIGFVDDYVVPKLMKGKRGLGWKQKLLMMIAICIASLYLSGTERPITIAVGTFFVLFFSNAYNFSDGIDGLAGSLGLILFGTLATVFLVGGGPNLVYAVPSLAMCAGFLVFLFWNRYPAKVFMGDVGALPIGALLGFFVFKLGRHGPEPVPSQVWLGILVFSLMMMIELVPVPIQIASVKLLKKRVFPKTPIHHAFQEAGWKETKIVAVFAGFQLVTAVLAGYLLLSGGPK